MRDSFSILVLFVVCSQAMFGAEKDINIVDLADKSKAGRHLEVISEIDDILSKKVSVETEIRLRIIRIASVINMAKKDFNNVTFLSAKSTSSYAKDLVRSSIDFKKLNNTIDDMMQGFVELDLTVIFDEKEIVEKGFLTDSKTNERIVFYPRGSKQINNLIPPGSYSLTFTVGGVKTKDVLLVLKPWERYSGTITVEKANMLLVNDPLYEKGVPLEVSWYYKLQDNEVFVVQIAKLNNNVDEVIHRAETKRNKLDIKSLITSYGKYSATVWIKTEATLEGLAQERKGSVVEFIWNK